jgi:phospholipid transport system substrate-binding protein
MPAQSQAAFGTRRLVLAGLSLLPFTPARARRAASPLETVRALTRGLTEVMRAGKTAPFKARFERLAPVIDEAFDLAAILATSVGPRFGSLAVAERADLLAVFRTYTVASYVSHFDAFDGETFEIDGETRVVGTDQVVRSRIVPRNGAGTRLDYLTREVAGAWRIVDVLADGTISRVAVQRSDFRAVLGREMNTAALADSLRRKIAELSGGALA